MAQKYLNNKDLLSEIHKSKMSSLLIARQYDRSTLLPMTLKNNQSI